MRCRRVAKGPREVVHADDEKGHRSDDDEDDENVHAYAGWRLVAQ